MGAVETWIRRASAPGLSPFGNAMMGERYNRALFRAKARALASALRAEALPAPRDRRCLDVGVGHGWLLETWRRQGIAVLAGLDAVAEVARRAKRAVPGAAVRVADLSEWKPAPRERYDLVCALDMLFYLTEDAAFERALGALAGAVDPGGILAISDSFVRRSVEGARNRPLSHYARILEAAGFRLRRRRCFFVLANHPYPREDGGTCWQNALYPAIQWGLWNLARARSPLARPLEVAAVEGIYALDSLILSQGGRWGSQEIAVWKRSPLGTPGYAIAPRPSGTPATP